MSLPVTLAVALAVSASLVASDASNDMFQAVLEYAAREPGAVRFCVLVEGKDASEAMLRSVDPEGKLLVPASQCGYVGEPDREQAVELSSQEPATFLSMTTYSPRPDGKPTVTVFYRAGSWQGYGRVLNISQSEGAWQVDGVAAMISE